MQHKWESQSFLGCEERPRSSAIWARGPQSFCDLLVCWTGVWFSEDIRTAGFRTGGFFCASESFSHFEDLESVFIRVL